VAVVRYCMRKRSIGVPRSVRAERERERERERARKRMNRFLRIDNVQSQGQGRSTQAAQHARAGPASPVGPRKRSPAWLMKME
jgi:hypothetical protein